MNNIVENVFVSSLEGKLFKSAKEISLDELKGGVEFLPKFKALNFIIKDKKIYKRGPHGAEYFVEIRPRDMIAELRLRGQKDVEKAINYHGGDFNKMMEELKNTGKFKTKKIAKIAGKLSPMGSGKHIELGDEKVSIKAKEKNGYSRQIKDSYYKSLSATSDAMTKALEKIGLVPVIGRDEIWYGGYTGALSDGDTWRGRIDLVTKDGKEVKNSMLIINLYKDNSKRNPYELNTYLS